MTENKAELWVGIVVTLAILIFVASVIWGRGEDVLARKTYLTVLFNDVHGLEEGDPVFVRGVKSGSVETIILMEGYTEVRLWIKEIPLYEDIRITIGVKELMGGKQISIDPGYSGRPLSEQSILHGSTSGDIGSFFSVAQGSLNRADTLLLSLLSLVESGRIQAVLKNVEESTQQTKRMLIENRYALHLTLERLEDLTNRIQRDSTVENVNKLVKELDHTVGVIRQVATDMENGTLGRLIDDRWLYDQMMKTVFDLDSLILDIKKNPKKYVRFSLF